MQFLKLKHFKFLFPQRLTIRNFSKTNYNSRNKMGDIEISINNGVQVIKLNRPEKKNAITHKMYTEITTRLNNSAKDNSLALTVLTGTGDYYSSGNDFSLDTISDPQNLIKEAGVVFQKFVAAFIDYPKLLIAVVNGPAIGIAATTLALCDVVYASDKAWFLTPFSRIGLTPEGCSSLTFPRIMGSAKASKLLYLNEVLTANEALTCGFVTEIFPDSELISKTSTLIQEFAKIPSEERDVQMELEKWYKNVHKGGLKIREEKSEVMAVGRDNVIESNILLNGKPMKGLLKSKELVRGWDRDLLHRVNQEESRVLLERFGSEEFYNALLTFNKKKSKL